jgi:hypothetical protein
MAADGSNYPRHAPKPEFAPVPQSDPASPSGILNAAGRTRPRKAHPGTMGAVASVSSPLDFSNSQKILAASGLGRRAPAAKDRGEEMSDADKPTQAVESLPDGSFIHHRRNPATGNVNSNPIGSGRTLDDYPNLNHAPMPANVGELQQRLGVPDLFGGDEF